jgi:hypothetical protein
MSPTPSSSMNNSQDQAQGIDVTESLPVPCSSIKMLLAGGTEEDTSIFLTGPELFTRSLLEELSVIGGFLSQRKLENQDTSLLSKAFRDGDTMMFGKASNSDAKSEDEGASESKDRERWFALRSVVQDELNDNKIDGYLTAVEAAIALLRSREWMYTMSAFHSENDTGVVGCPDNDDNGGSISIRNINDGDNVVVDRVVKEILFSRERVERMVTAIQRLEAHVEELNADIEKVSEMSDYMRRIE